MAFRPFLFSLLLLTPLSHACEHLGLGVPKQSDFIQCREGYAIGYNFELKSAEWVSYRLVGTTEDGVERTDDFREDPFIPARYRTTPKDYDEKKFDQGHLANSESIDGSIIANSETFYLSNMTPQLPGHNRAIWKGLENRERKWALLRGEVMVLAGPLYESPGEPDAIGPNGVPIPTHYWKVIYDLKGGEVIGFLIPHEELKTSKLNNYLISVDAIEARADVDLLSLLPDEFEAKIESHKLSEQW